VRKGFPVGGKEERVAPEAFAQDEIYVERGGKDGELSVLEQV
jgi:hypothetical protein